ncbi:MAG: 5'/3'-nucleotidase SurE [Bacteroidia bacterium]|nr:5'/3'-nucleotidase SurE [Bacteroidia bacterium]
MEIRRPVILISNDDGIQAGGILALSEVARSFGDVIVVAPDSPQSAMGHAITITKPLRLYKEKLADGSLGYACNGTPADCVKLATGVLLKRNPDLVLSGINHGTNSSASTIYSGTLSAAREGAIQGIPAIGFSLCNYSDEADMTAAKEIVRTIIATALRQKFAAGQLLNVNIPNLPLEAIKGIKTTRQAAGRWVEEFDERTDPQGRKYYWLTGKFILQDDRDDSDEAALNQGFVSVTPLTHDLTHLEMFEVVNKWEFTA